MNASEPNSIQKFLCSMLNKKSWTNETYERLTDLIREDADSLQNCLSREELAAINALWIEYTRNKEAIDKERRLLEDPEKIEPGDLSRFHHHNTAGKCTGVYDYEIKEYIKQNIKLFILGGVPYIYSHGVYEADPRGVRLKTIINKFIYPNFIRSTTTKRIYELFLMDSELTINDTESLNQYPDYWINFKNAYYDPIERRMREHSPEHLSIYQIPHEYYPEQKPKGEKIKEWLNFICPEPDDKEMLLEYMGYCMTKDTRQQKCLILTGLGGTGKSIVIRLIESIIGEKNLSNISLSELTQKFAAYGLIGKLVNSCADLEVDALEDTNILKLALGEDRMRGEAKGQDAIFFRSRARMIFSTNELPIIKKERTNGFYRRILVLTMNRKPERVNTDLFEELNNEIDYLIRQCLLALSRMYAVGLIESKNSAVAVKRLRYDSDTAEAFINDCCLVEESYKAERSLLHAKYEEYCKASDRTPLQRNSFYRAIQAKGYYVYRASTGFYIRGLAIKDSGQASGEAPEGEWMEAGNQNLPFMDAGTNI